MAINLDAQINSGFSRQHNTAVQPSALVGDALAKVFDFTAIRAIRGTFTPNAAAAGYALVYDSAGNPVQIATTEMVVSAVIQAIDDGMVPASSPTLTLYACSTTAFANPAAISATSNAIPANVSGSNVILGIAGNQSFPCGTAVVQAGTAASSPTYLAVRTITGTITGPVECAITVLLLNAGVTGVNVTAT